MVPGLRTSNGNPSSPPYSNGPYNWDQRIFWKAQGGADPVNALIFGIGTSASPATSSTAGKVFMEFRCQTTATSGDNRLFYMRYDINGAGASGEAIRAFAKITAAASTCRGAHISLDVDTAGSCSGLGIGVDSQILIHNGALTGGTYAVGNFEIFSSGSSTDISGVTESSFIRCVLGGDTTGAANVDDNANLEGDVSAIDASTRTVRVGNYTQIPDKTVSV